MKLTLAQNKSFYRKLIALGVPLAIHQFITALINLLDTFMLGGVSETALVASGLANKLFFVFIMLISGAVTGASIFIAQFYGKGDRDSIQRYFGISLTVSAFIGLIFTLIAVFLPEYVMQIFTKSDAVVAQGADYLRVTGFAYIPFALSSCIYGALKSTRHAYIPLVFAVAALGANAILNYLFIYVFNMGILGAAYTTLAVRVAEFFILSLTVMLKKTAISAVSIKKYFSFSLEELKSYFRFAGFVIFVELEWSLGNALYSLAFKEYGTTFQAAVQSSDSCITLLNVFAIALGSAAAVIIGISIGEGKNDLAVNYAKRLYFLSIVCGAIIGVLMAALSPVLPLMFSKLTPSGKQTTTFCLLIMAVTMPFRCAEFMLMVGILRSGGDTKFCVMCDAVGVWGLALPALLISSYVLKLPFLITYSLIGIEIIFKVLVGTIRLFKSKKWLNNVTS